MFLSRTGMDLAGFRRSTMAVVALIVVALIPLLAGGATFWSFGHRVDTVRGIPVAVVNLDEGAEVTIDGQKKTVPLSRELVARLTQPATITRSTLVWTLTNESSATKGLSDGTFDAVLTIPATYSKALTSTGGDAPVQAVVNLTANDASSLLVSRVSEQVVASAITTAGHTMTKAFVKNVLIGFNDMAAGTQKEADGTQKLADGSQKLADGTTNLSKGTGKLADGTQKLADGTKKLADGALKLAAGGSKLAAGAGQLSAGAKKLGRGATGLGGGLDTMAAGLVPHANPASVPQHQMTVGDVASLSATASSGVSTGLSGLAQSCATSGASQTFCAQLAGLAAGSEQASALAAGTKTAVTKFHAGMTGFLTTYYRPFAKGLNTYADGVATFSKGTSTFATGLITFSNGVGQVSTGTASLANGTTKLASGTQKLADGSQKLADGTKKLADGLAGGVEKMSTYSAARRKAMTDVVTTPITSKTVHLYPDANGSAAVMAMLAPLVLWLGALASFFVLPAIPRRMVLSSASPLAAAFHGWWPATVLGVVQGALLGLTVPLLHLEPVHPWLLGGVAMLAALVFSAINQGLSGSLGTLGRLISLALLAAQTAMISGVLPLQTAPVLLQNLAGFAPTSLAASLMQRMLLGSAPTAAPVAVAGLLIWFALALLVSVWSVSHQRRAHARRETYLPEVPEEADYLPVAVG